MVAIERERNGASALHDSSQCNQYCAPSSATLCMMRFKLCACPRWLVPCFWTKCTLGSNFCRLVDHLCSEVPGGRTSLTTRISIILSRVLAFLSATITECRPRDKWKKLMLLQSR